VKLLTSTLSAEGFQGQSIYTASQTWPKACASQPACREKGLPNSASKLTLSKEMHKSLMEWACMTIKLVVTVFLLQRAHADFSSLTQPTRHRLSTITKGRDGLEPGMSLWSAHTALPSRNTSNRC